MDKDVQMCEMQHMIDGQQFTIEAQDVRIKSMRDLIEDITSYFSDYLTDKDSFALNLMKERRR